MVGSNYLETLHAEIGLDNLPPEYGGTSVEDYPAGNTLSEEELRARLGYETFVIPAGTSGRYPTGCFFV
jgi:hypothetical protein